MLCGFVWPWLSCAPPPPPGVLRRDRRTGPPLVRSPLPLPANVVVEDRDPHPGPRSLTPNPCGLPTPPPPSPCGHGRHVPAVSKRVHCRTPSAAFGAPVAPRGAGSSRGGRPCAPCTTCKPVPIVGRTASASSAGVPAASLPGSLPVVDWPRGGGASPRCCPVAAATTPPAAPLPPRGAPRLRSPVLLELLFLVPLLPPGCGLGGGGEYGVRPSHHRCFSSREATGRCVLARDLDRGGRGILRRDTGIGQWGGYTCGSTSHSESESGSGPSENPDPQSRPLILVRKSS